MKFLCCGEYDQSDGEDQPPRPARVPDKPHPLKTADSGVKITAPTIPPTLNDDFPIAQEKPEKPEKADLWKEAFNSLSEERQKLISEGESVSTTDAINGVINQTREKYTEWQKSGLKVKRKNGEDINLRDGAEKILNSALQAQELIADIVAFDPTGKASAAWAVVSLGLTMISTDIERRDAMFASSEYLAEKLAYYALVDKHYRAHQLEGGQNFDRALVEVYTAILEYTAEVTKVQQENILGRIVRSIKSIDEQHLPQLQKSIEAKQAEAEKWANLVNTINDRTRAQKILDDVDETLALTKKVYSKMLNGEEVNILTWMSNFDYSVPHKRTQEYRTADTGTWLLNSQEYKDWKTLPGSVLWLPGVVGCGKSVLCSTIIKDIEELCEKDSSKSLGYWYFESIRNDSQSVESMMSSLIRQLSQSPLSSSVREGWQLNSKKGGRPDRGTIATMLDDVISDMPSDVFLVIDALDECPTTGKERPHLLSLLADLAEVQKKKIHILATSRPEQDIRVTMEKFPSINLEEKQANDVETFVLAALKEDLKDVDEETKSSIVDALLNTGERRFRWADLQLKRLQYCPTNEDIRVALHTIPQTLEDTYQEIVDKIKQDKNQSFARQMLMFCAFAAAPLDVETVRASVPLRSSNFVLSICTTSLLAVSSEIVRLAHFSVKEFLVVPKNFDDTVGCRFSEVAAHEMLATKTVDLLLKQTAELTEEAAMTQGFLIYAANHWHAHVTALGDSSLWPVDLPDKVDRLFTDPTIYLNWSRIAKRGEGSTMHWSRLPRYCLSPINFAARIALRRTVHILADQGANPMDDGECSPTIMAASRGYFELLDVLLKKDFPLSVTLPDEILQRLSLGEEKEVSEASRMRLRTVLNTMRELGCLYNSWQGSGKTPVGQITGKTIGMGIIGGALLNNDLGLEILRQFLHWHDMGLASFTFSGNVLNLVLHRRSDRDEALDLLFGRYKDEIPIPARILDPVSGTLGFGEVAADWVVAVVLRKPAAVNLNKQGLSSRSMAQHCSTEQVELMLQAFPDIRVTEDVLAGAARNSSHPDMLAFLWPRREQDVSITDDILVGLTGTSSLASLKGIISGLGPDTQLKGCVKMPGERHKIMFEISEKMIEMAISRPDDPIEMLEMLDSLSNNGRSEVPVTERLVSVAVNHPKYANSLITYLSRMQGKPIPVTEDTLVKALKKDDPSVAIALIEKCSEVPQSDQVFVAACANPSALSIILDKCSNSVPVDKIIAAIADEEPSAEVLEMLFDRKLLVIDEQLLEDMAGRYDTLTAVLSRVPDMPIADIVLMEATQDARSVRLLLDKRDIDVKLGESMICCTIRGHASDQFHAIVEYVIKRVGTAAITEDVFTVLLKNTLFFNFAFPWLCRQLGSGDNPFTEDVLITAMYHCISSEFKQVVEAMINQTGSAPITEKVFVEISYRSWLCDLIPWLCDQRQSTHEPSIEEIFVAAANPGCSWKFQDVIENFVDYMGIDYMNPEFITEKVLRATIFHCLPEAFQWLSDLLPDLSLTLEDTCHAILQDPDIAAKDKVKPLMCLGRPVDGDTPKVSPSLLASYPYDLEEGNNYGLDDLVNELVNDPDEYKGLPISDPQGMAEIVLERCGFVAVSNFLKALPEILISDTLIEAAKKNVVANQDELVSLLEKERDTRTTGPE